MAAQTAAQAALAAQLKGLAHFDLTLTNTMATDLRVELFNFDFSQTDVYNPSVQQAPQQFYHPIGNNFQPLIIKNGTTNGYLLSFPIGGFDAFVNAASAVPPSGFNSNAYCGFDENGNLIYQPGYVDGVVDAGNVTISSTQTNYRHLFRVLGKCRMTINFIRLKVNAAYVDQLNQQFTYTQNNIVAAASSVPFTPSTFSGENVQQENIITVPVSREINPKSGLWYTVQAEANSIPNVVNMTVFFTPITKGMLDMI